MADPPRGQLPAAWLHVVDADSAIDDILTSLAEVREAVEKLRCEKVRP